MDIAVLDKIAGTGVISISRWDSGEVPGGEPIDRELPARLSGSYSEKKGTTRLNVKGFDEGKGSSVQLELDDELQFHVEKRIAEFMAKGATRDEAERLARARLGNVHDLTEFCRHMDTRITFRRRLRT